MNFYFLVEGRRTEKRVYGAWIKHVFPHMTQVNTYAGLVTDSYLIVSGGGQPAILEEIGAALETICQRPIIDHLFICIDSEDDEYQAKVAELRAAIAEHRQRASADERAPGLCVHAIVQDCCIETWLLGHTKMMRVHPTSPELADYKAFYDVRVRDPENMPSMHGDVPRAVFHGVYLRQMLRERNAPGCRYTKQHPGIVTRADYLYALAERCATTDHLASLRHLLDIWRDLGWDGAT